MCGLIASWSATPKSPTLHQAAMDVLKVRGPDEQSSWVSDDGTVFLGHCRLSITGQQGTQPLWNKERTCVAVVNGQFYDQLDLTRQCQHDGYEFLTDSDSELLLALYEQYGTDAIEYLEGEYAFVLWDLRRDLVWCGRDRSGVKPLKYVCDGDVLMLASETKALIAAGHRPRWNTTALAQALSCQYLPPTATFFDGVEQLAPGQTITFTRPSGTWTKRAQQWWSWFSTPAQQLVYWDPDQAMERLDQKLSQSVRRRVHTPWPVAVHLSGGCDSTAILQYAQQHATSGLKAFCVGFSNVPGHVVHDERHIALQTAAQLGVDIDIVPVDPQDVLRHWDTAVARTEQLAINGHVVAKWMLARHINAQGFRVSLSGEGADEALLGYPFLTAQQHPLAQHGLASHNPVAVGLMLPDSHQIASTPIQDVWGEIPVWLSAKLSMAWKTHQLLDPLFTQQLVPPAMEAWARDTSSLASPHSIAVHRASGRWASLALGGYILPALADAPEAGFHIQGRVPFLDGDLLDEVTRWRPSVSNSLTESKAPLRRLLRRQGLHHVADRAKHPFQSPPLLSDPFVRTQLRQKWEDPHYWSNTPIHVPSLVRLMKEWEHWDWAQMQAWEPVICTLLSVASLNKMMEK